MGGQLDTFVLEFFENFAWFKRNQIRIYGELNIDYPGAFACRVLSSSSLFTRLRTTLSLSLSLSLSFSLSRFLFILSLSFSRILSIPLSLAFAISLSLYLSLAFARSCAHTLSLSLSVSPSFTLSHPLTLSRSSSLTHSLRALSVAFAHPKSAVFLTRNVHLSLIKQSHPRTHVQDQANFTGQATWSSDLTHTHTHTR